VTDYQTIQNELATYRTNLAEKLQIVVLSKSDLVLEEELAEKRATLQVVVPKGVQLLTMSAQAHENIQEVLYVLRNSVNAERARMAVEAPVVSEVPVLRLKDQLSWRVSHEGSVFTVTGGKIEKFAARTDFENEEGVARLRAIMRKQGIIHELRRQGSRPGDKIRIAGHVFDY
jgi:GTP-binding protein